jgi:hypothetical protein
VVLLLPHRRLPAPHETALRRERGFEVLARTGSGDVDVLLPAGPQAYAVTARTGSGDRDVDVRTDAESDRVVDVETGSGDASVPYPDAP